jgi:hypothetical protein
MLIDFVRRKEQGGILFAGRAKLPSDKQTKGDESKPETETVMTGR